LYAVFFNTSCRFELILYYNIARDEMKILIKSVKLNTGIRFDFFFFIAVDTVTLP